MATHSIILAWEIPWTEEPSRLQPMGSQGVGHNWVTKQQQQQVKIFVSGKQIISYFSSSNLKSNKQAALINGVFCLFSDFLRSFSLSNFLDRPPLLIFELYRRIWRTPAVRWLQVQSAEELTLWGALRCMSPLITGRRRWVWLSAWNREEEWLLLP